MHDRLKPKKRPSTNSIPIFRQMLLNFDEEKIFKTAWSITEAKFISMVWNNSFPSDQQVCEELFKVKRSTKYNRMKSRIRAKLVLMMINQEAIDITNDSYGSAYRRANAEMAAFNILSKKGQNLSAAYIAELLVATSIQFDFGEFIEPTCSYLFEHYMIYNYDEEKAFYFENVLSIYRESNRVEQHARNSYSRLMNLFVMELDPGNKAFLLGNELLLPLEPYINKVPSTQFHLYTFLIQTFRSYGNKDFKAMNLAAESGYNYFKNLVFRRPLVENTFLRKSVEANLVLGEFDYCAKLLTNIKLNSKIGTRNWFNTLEILSTLDLHKKLYNRAARTFLEGKSSSRFNDQMSSTKKRWGLLEAYINFLQLAGAAPEAPTMSRYRINKFINETPQYSEDKKGRNIQLIIAQLLFYIIDKNWDKMEEKIDALQKYRTRYLKKNELFRSQVFIKMLLEIPRRMYHPQAIIRHTAKYRKRLEEMAPNIDLNGSTLEIIPYEDLWELIIQRIVPPKYTRKSAIEIATPQ